MPTVLVTSVSKKGEKKTFLLFIGHLSRGGPSASGAVWAHTSDAQQRGSAAQLSPGLWHLTVSNVGAFFSSRRALKRRRRSTGGTHTQKKATDTRRGGDE